MSAYNLLNSRKTPENTELLTGILRIDLTTSNARLDDGVFLPMDYTQLSMPVA